MEPGQRRMATRPGNATRHPGDVLRVFRPKEVIEVEKQEKLARRRAKEEKKLAEEARKAAGEEHMAQLEVEAAAATAAEKNQYPRRRVQRMKGSIPHKIDKSTNKGRKQRVAEQEEATAQAEPTMQSKGPQKEDVQGKAPVKRPAPRPIFKTSRTAQSGQVSPEMETSELSEEVTPTRPAKRAKGGAPPLRRTETEINFTKDERAANTSKHTLPRDNLSASELCTEDEKMDVDDDNKEETPQPLSSEEELTGEEGEGNEALKTPLATAAFRKNMKRIFATLQSEDEIEIEEVPTEQRQRRKTKNGGSATKGKELMKEHNTWATVNATATSHVKSASSSATAVPAAAAGNNKWQSSIIGNDQEVASEMPVARISFTVVPRTTASNADVVTKGATVPALLPKKVRKKKFVKAPETVEEPEPEGTAASGGMRSDEDDALDRQMALSSPMKGSDLRKLNQNLKIKVEPPGGVKPSTSRKSKPTFDNLPKGANDDDAWTQIAIPAYFNEFLGGDNAWIYKEEQFKKLLKITFDHVYGNRLSLDINKGSVAYEILYQRTCQHRNSFGTKALDVVWMYYRTKVDRNADLTQNKEEIAQWASSLLDSKGFLYKGSERTKPKQTGPMEHSLILQTLTAHFSVNTVIQTLPGGLRTRRPYCSLALAATAVERALTLCGRQVVEKKASTGKKAFKLSIIRTLNPDTGVHSTVENDFSKDNWADVTMEYLRGIKNMADDRFDRIFSIARQLSRGGGKYQEPNQSTTAMGSAKSFRECLVSEGESGGEETTSEEEE